MTEQLPDHFPIIWSYHEATHAERNIRAGGAPQCWRSPRNLQSIASDLGGAGLAIETDADFAIGPIRDFAERRIGATGHR